MFGQEIRDQRFQPRRIPEYTENLVSHTIQTILSDFFQVSLTAPVVSDPGPAGGFSTAQAISHFNRTTETFSSNIKELN